MASEDNKDTVAAQNESNAGDAQVKTEAGVGQKRARDEDDTASGKEAKQKTEESKNAEDKQATEEAPKIVVDLGAGSDDKGAVEEAIEDKKSEENGATIIEAKVTPIQMMPDGKAMQQLDCPPALVGRVIGRAGATIRWLEQKTNTRLQIDQNFPPGEPRKIQIMGAPADMENAIKVITETMHNGPPNEQTGMLAAPMQAQIPVTGATGPEVTETFDIPQHLVGRVIGRGGETIRDLQARTACRIQIDQNFPQGMPRKVTVSGPQALVTKGVAMVKDVMENGPPRPGMGAGPSMGAPATMNAMGQFTKILDCDPGLVGRVIGRKGETINEIQRKSGARIQIDQSMPPGQPRKIQITGSQAAVNMGVEICKNIMANPSSALNLGSSGPPRQYGSYNSGGGYGGGYGGNFNQGGGGGYGGNTGYGGSSYGNQGSYGGTNQYGSGGGGQWQGGGGNYGGGGGGYGAAGSYGSSTTSYGGANSGYTGGYGSTSTTYNQGSYGNNTGYGGYGGYDAKGASATSGGASTGATGGGYGGYSGYGSQA